MPSRVSPPAVRGLGGVGVRASVTESVPALVPDRVRSGLAFGSAALDCHGRVNDRPILTTLGWVGGQRLAVREEPGLIVVAIPAAS